MLSSCSSSSLSTSLQWVVALTDISDVAERLGKFEAQPGYSEIE
jgi:hypothetical protein